MPVQRTKASARAKKWDKNVSPVGWYLATYIERFEFEDEDMASPRRRCRAWQNTILVRAKTPATAYRRAVHLARVGEDTPWKDDRGVPGRLLFEGLTHLVPIYDELEDGAELSWIDHRNISVARVKKMIRSREELPCLQPESRT